MIRGFCLGSVPLHGIGAPQLKVGERSDGRVQHNAAVVENLLKLSCGFAPMTGSEIRFAALIDGIESSVAHHTPQFIGTGRSKSLDGLRSVAASECKLRMQG